MSQVGKRELRYYVGETFAKSNAEAAQSAAALSAQQAAESAATFEPVIDDIKQLKEGLCAVFADHAKLIAPGVALTLNLLATAAYLQIFSVAATWYWYASGGIMTIEGNTGADNDANGGQVQRRVRSNKVILGAFRPDYDQEEKEKANMNNNIPDSYAAEAVKWVQANKIIQGDASGSLQLHQPCTVQKVVVLLWRFAKLLGRA